MSDIVNNRDVKLVCRDTAFYTFLDEEVFFYWIDKIPAVSGKKGVANELYIFVNKDKVSETDLKEFLALFHKYGIDMKQLRKLINKKNKEWFFDKKNVFWHKKVIPDKEKFDSEFILND